MSKLKSLALSLVMAGGLAALGFAADTSATINTRKLSNPVGNAPQVGYVEATATATNAFTVDLPVLSNRGTNSIVGVLTATYDVSGSVKHLNVARMGRTLTVTGSNQTSGTLAVGDKLRAVVIYEP